MANYGHCAVNAMNVACPLDVNDGAVHDLGMPPTMLAEYALQIGPLFSRSLIFIY